MDFLPDSIKKSPEYLARFANKTDVTESPSRASGIPPHTKQPEHTGHTTEASPARRVVAFFLDLLFVGVIMFYLPMFLFKFTVSFDSHSWYVVGIPVFPH